VKKNPSVYIAAIILFGSAMAAPLSAQQPRYKLIDMGTFGGPSSYINPGSANDFGQHVTVLNRKGEITGFADTSKPDPFPNYCFSDCYVAHAFRSNRSGVLTNLGALHGGGSSLSTWITDNGLMARFSENGETDPLYPGLPQLRAVLWQDGKIKDLGTLEGGYQSEANAVNSSGQVVGASLNTIPDSNSMQPATFNLWYQLQPPYGYQTRAFVWSKEDGMLDLGTLGGADAQALLINERGQILGHSYIGSTQSPSCNYPLATDSFLWDNEKGMVDLGTLGGTCTLGFDLNQKGQVVGVSNLEGDQVSHAFLWSNGVLNDLGGSLGGSFTGTSALNERGEAAGFATLSDNVTFHAVLWRRVGHMTDLGVLGNDQCSYATGINTREEVVGTSISVCNSDNANFRAFLWQHGSMMTDLNALIPSGSPLYLQFVETINDRGEIAGTGVDASGNEHAFLLVPCANNSPSGCDTGGAAVAAPAQAMPAERALTPTHNSIRPMLSAQWKNPLDPSARNSGLSRDASSSPLMIVSSAPPNGTVWVNYDPTSTEKCVWSPVFGWHEVCNPCSYSSCSSLPPCRGLSPLPCRKTIFLEFTFKATGGVSPYKWSASGMPPGLNVDPISGEILGTPTTTGSYYVTVGLTDSESPPSHASAHYTIRISP
jgi:probable HAF family extracellular repeat protein